MGAAEDLAEAEFEARQRLGRCCEAKRGERHEPDCKTGSGSVRGRASYRWSNVLRSEGGPWLKRRWQVDVGGRSQP